MTCLFAYFPATDSIGRRSIDDFRLVREVHYTMAGYLLGIRKPKPAIELLKRNPGVWYVLPCGG